MLVRVAAGQSNKEIAHELALSEPAVKKHLSHLLQRYGVPNRTALVRVALRTGVIAD